MKIFFLIKVNIKKLNYDTKVWFTSIYAMFLFGIQQLTLRFYINQFYYLKLELTLCKPF